MEPETKMKAKAHSFIAFLNCSKETLLLIIIVAIASITITTTVSILLNKKTNLTVPSLGTIKTIGVEAYWDQNKENETETINWDELWVGSEQNVTLYIQSISNYEVTLSINTTDWNDEKISDYMTLSWDYDRKPINPGETIQVTITLSASPSSDLIEHLIANDIKNFSFDIHILATAIER